MQPTARTFIYERRPSNLRKKCNFRSNHCPKWHTKRRRWARLASTHKRQLRTCEAFAKYLHFQLRQQAATDASIKKEYVEAITIKKSEVQELMLAREQLEVEHRRHAQFVQFVGALNFMKREYFDNLLGHRVYLDNVLANCPAIARKVEAIERYNAAKNEVLEKIKGTHQQFVDIIQKLLKHAGQGDVGEESETKTARIGVFSRATPC